jgi:hypothetical protein
VTKLLRSVLVAAPLAVGLAAVAAPAAHAAGSGLPYTDPRAKGSITLCDSSGHPITSGNIHDRPTVAWVVSSTAAPAGYAVKNGKATLYAFQPRQQVNPAEWSGQQVSGSSLYTNPVHPMAEVTTGDKPVGDFVAAYPPKWDGLVELRLYLTAPNKLLYNVRYPTANLRVTGTTFVVVNPGNTSCTLGRALSNERVLLPASAFPKPSLASPRPSTGSGANPGPTTATAAATASPAVSDIAAGQSSTDPSGGGSSPVLIGLLGVAVVGALAVAWYVFRNRPGTG